MSIEKPLYYLLHHEPFYAHFLLGTRVILDDPKVPTAGAHVSKSGINLYFNTEFVFTRPLQEQVAILKHEILHIMLEHCGARGIKHSNRMAKNIAMDCAINQYIRDLPEGGVTLEGLKAQLKIELQPFETWEYYYEKLKQAGQKDNQDPHNHDMMDSGEELSPAEIEQIKAQVVDATQKATRAAGGNIPEGLASVIQKLSAPAKIPWKQQLRNLVANARSVKLKNTRMKPNRRFDLEQPGTKKERELVIGVCLDSSGSVSDESYAAFMTEVGQLSKSSSITYLIQADCEVHKIDVIKGGKAKGDVLKSRHGHGGTAYQPAIDACVQRKCDVIIYLGDMDSADTPTDPKIPFIWVRVGDQEPPGAFGKVIDLC